MSSELGRQCGWHGIQMTASRPFARCQGAAGRLLVWLMCLFSVLLALSVVGDYINWCLIVWRGLSLLSGLSLRGFISLVESALGCFLPVPSSKIQQALSRFTSRAKVSFLGVLIFIKHLLHYICTQFSLRLFKLYVDFRLQALRRSRKRISLHGES